MIIYFFLIFSITKPNFSHGKSTTLVAEKLLGNRQILNFLMYALLQDSQLKY